MLEGLRIVEVEGLGPAPFAGMLLADLGAEVIVCHRDEPPMATAPARSLIDRGKKSIVLDLKKPDDVDILRRLIATADGLIEGFRPGVMERLGVGPDDVRTANPRLVYGRMTGWGQDGPLASAAGHDFNYMGVSGALWYGSPPDAAPWAPPTLVGDIGGGAMYLVAGMLAGLLKAERTGKGTVVDAAIVDGSAHMMNLLMAGRAAKMLTAARGTSLLDGPPWNRCYRCADGAWLSVQCLEPKFFAVFRERLGLDPDSSVVQDPDPESWPSIALELEGIFASRSQREWLERFEGSDACVAPVLEPSNAAQHPHLLARQTWVEIDGQLQASAAPRFDGNAPAPPRPAPRRGEHGSEILAMLGDTPA